MEEREKERRERSSEGSLDVKAVVSVRLVFSPLKVCPPELE